MRRCLVMLVTKGKVFFFSFFFFFFYFFYLEMRTKLLFGFFCKMDFDLVADSSLLVHFLYTNRQKGICFRFEKWNEWEKDEKQRTEWKAFGFLILPFIKYTHTHNTNAHSYMNAKATLFLFQFTWTTMH